MISRRTTLALARLFTCAFGNTHGQYFNRPTYRTMNDAAGEVYDFLYQNGYPAWFCNVARDVADQCSSDTRPFRDFVLMIHTGESLAPATPNLTWRQREKVGQELLKDLAEDLAKWRKDRTYVSPEVGVVVTEFLQNLELDGYVFRADALLAPEEGVVDAKEQSGVLQDLYTELGLQNQETVFHHLSLSEEHFIARRWDDSISNSRKFLEGVLQEVAASHHRAVRGSAIPDDVYSRPARVRDYLESSGLLEQKEKQALSSSYGLLSETGGHPYMAQNDQARLLRHLALTFSQFALLRLKGFKNT